MKDIVIFDLDGTLADIEHRVHLAEAKQWGEFHKAGVHDTPHQEACELFCMLQDSYELIIVTGRNERYRKQTILWLEDVAGLYPDEILMRPDDDFTPDYELKPRLLKEHLGEEFPHRVLLIFEDRDRVVEEWRNLGLVCYQVRNGSY